MSTLTEIYKNPEKIKEYVKDLYTLNEICDFRYEAGYTFGVRMERLYLLDGHILLDECGNTMVKIYEDNSAIQRYSISPIPTPKDTCECCDKGWDIDNMKDFIVDRFYDEESMATRKFFFHTDCYKKYLAAKTLKTIQSIIGKVYDLDKCEFTPIENRYYPDPLSEPWYEVDTPDGKIQIGKRKRVYSITWFNPPANFDMRAFGKYKVSMGRDGVPFYIHADTKGDAELYLKKMYDLYATEKVKKF